MDHTVLPTIHAFIHEWNELFAFAFPVKAGLFFTEPRGWKAELA